MADMKQPENKLSSVKTFIYWVNETVYVKVALGALSDTVLSPAGVQSALTLGLKQTPAHCSASSSEPRAVVCTLSWASSELGRTLKYKLPISKEVILEVAAGSGEVGVAAQITDIGVDDADAENTGDDNFDADVLVDDGANPENTVPPAVKSVDNCFLIYYVSCF